MLQFKSLKSFPNIIHAVFTREFSNVSPHIAAQSIVTVDQIHSDKIVVVATPQTKPLAADGLITNQPGINLLIKTADCIPLFLLDPIHRAIGLIHVGWKGANQSIHTQAVKLMAKHFDTLPGDIIVGIGPAICANCYTSTGQPGQADHPRWRKFITRTGPTWQVDLKGLVKSELLAFGINPNHIEDMNICTYEDNRFFSHRRSLKTKEVEGRFASIIALKS